jgi:hypothetical protein
MKLVLTSPFLVEHYSWQEMVMHVFSSTQESSQSLTAAYSVSAFAFPRLLGLSELYPHLSARKPVGFLLTPHNKVTAQLRQIHCCNLRKPLLYPRLISPLLHFRPDCFRAPPNFFGGGTGGFAFLPFLGFLLTFTFFSVSLNEVRKCCNADKKPGRLV